MKSRYWFLLSVMLFIAAAYFWRLGENKRVEQSDSKSKTLETSPIASQKVPTTLPTTVPASSTSSSKKVLTDSSTNAAAADATNAPALYPHRLKNTDQMIDELVRNDRAILLRNALIDTGVDGVKIPNELRSQGDPGSYIVQARGVIDATFRAALIEAKAEIISYVPNNAYLVRMTGGLGKLAGNKQVQFVLPYEPYYKLDTELLALAMDKKSLQPGQVVRVGLFPGQRDAAVAALEKAKAQIIGEDLKSSPFGPELIVASADLIQLANMPQVQEIEPFYEREIMNDLTRVRVGVSSNTITTENFLDLTGLNVWVNVNDSTIDNGHPDLTPRIFPAAGVGVVDPDGHGTHVAGIIASSGANGPGGSVVNVGSVAGANFRGKAPASFILSQDIFSGLSDAELQIVAAETNYNSLNLKSPLISNNSWGYGTRTYNSSAASFDAAVRDALPGKMGSQPIAYVFAAGNSGGGGLPGTVTSPGTAKNVISVGALENKRNLTNDVIRPNANCVVVTNKEFLGLTDSSNQIANFSSRGNVGISQEGTFGRLKPDLVAPGTFIASTRSRQFDEASYYSPLRTEGNSFPGLVIDPFATNNFLIFIPDNPCDEGATLELTISANITSSAPPDAALLIFGGTTPNPSSVPGNLLGVNSVTIPRNNLPLDEFYYYDIVNTNDLEIIYTLSTSLLLSNDFGAAPNGYFHTLSNLNSQLAPNYMFESGTSMSAPAISGMLALVQEFFEQRFQITNSPAMMKALLINGSRAIGSGYNKEAVLNNAGWGLPDLRRILPTNGTAATWPVQLFDQSTNFALATGDRHDRLVTMNDTNSPLRITLVWTDPAGNPAVGVKLVNDLDLVVTTVATNGLDTNNQPIITTNVYYGNNFPGGEFTQSSVPGTNGLNELSAARDLVNNVENVYINGPLSGQYMVSVIGRRVNVNAVTAHTNGIVQDYALVISADTATNAPFTVDTNSIVGLQNTNAFVTVVTNGLPLFNQRVGANSPLINVNSNNLTDGTTNQWAFYVLNNPSNFTNVAFLTFLPPNLSGASNTVPGSRRVIEADIDLYVSTDPTLTNLNPAAIAAADKSRKRGGQELIAYTNRSDPVFYVGIKSEDQRAAEFSFFAIASATPFSEENNGNITVYGVPLVGVDIPDGSPDNPGGGVYVMIATSDAKVGRVVVTNDVEHERLGDLMMTLTHEGSAGENFAVLMNHSFPNGQETGRFRGIYDDSGLGDVVAPSTAYTVLGSDGPGSLLNFVGDEAAGAWLLTVEDNSLNSTGRVHEVSMLIERALETNELNGRSGFTFSGGIPANQSRALSFVVPPNATNMIISVAPKEGPLDTVVRRGRLAPTRGPYVDKGALISPPGGIITVNGTDSPPLRPGRYVLRLFNGPPSSGPVTFTGFVQFELDLTAASQQTYTGGGSATLIDDAVTESIINVDRNERVVATEVSVRIDHPRVSDLVLHLVSPQGTRILLAENRGGLSTNGYGFSNLTTNTVSAQGQTDGGAYTNPISTTLNSGIINVNYDFQTVPDNLRIYYDGSLIYDSGLISGSGNFSVPFGPGTDTTVFIVMNEGGNPDPGTFWDYTATILSGDMVYATFSDNTNLARVPIKFAIPPFATNVPGSLPTFMSSYFENDPAGTYTTTVDGWNVTTNSVDVVANGNAHRGTNFLSLDSGVISRTLPTTAGEFYNLKFAYRRAQPANLSSANITLGGVFTNEFVGNPSWIIHSTSFVAPNSGTTLDISSFSQGGGLVQVISNGSFEFGLTNWVVTSGNASINPYPGTASQGTNFVIIGGGDVPGSILSQNFPISGGSNYVLNFDVSANGDVGRTGIVEVQITTINGTVTSQLFTNAATQSPYNYQNHVIAFTAPLGLTNATLNFVDRSPNNGIAVDPVFDNVSIVSSSGTSALDPGMWFDTFELTEGGDPNYFQPEESLRTLVGENARGDWKLEIWDNRVGAPFGPAQLLSWQLHLTFASTNASATTVINATPATNTVAGSEIKYFIVDVPIFATRATNTLVSGGGPLNLLFNHNGLPIGDPSLGDVTLLSSTLNGTAILTTTTLPDLRPGGRYYLGVQNADPSQTNFFTFSVTFDDTNNLVSVTPLVNATPYSTNLPLSANIHYFQYDLANSASSIQFKLFNMNADADLVVRRNQLPTKTLFDFNSTLGGTNDDVINVANPTPGRYYLGVYGYLPSVPITYTVMVTEGVAAPAPVLSGEPTLSASGFHVTANTIIGRQYQFDVSLDLVTWTTISTTTATANITTFTDPTPPATQTARFYRLKLLP